MSLTASIVAYPWTMPFQPSQAKPAPHRRPLTSIVLRPARTRRSHRGFNTMMRSPTCGLRSSPPLKASRAGRRWSRAKSCNCKSKGAAPQRAESQGALEQKPQRARAAWESETSAVGFSKSAGYGKRNSRVLEHTFRTSAALCVCQEAVLPKPHLVRQTPPLLLSVWAGEAWGAKESRALVETRR